MKKSNRIYHINVGKKQLGPYTKGELEGFLKNNKINETTYVFREGMNKWEYIRELPEFDKRQKSVAPPPPPQDSEIPEGSIKDWIVFDKGTKYGPYSFLEIKALVEQKRLRRSAPLWKKGMKDWVKMLDHPDFREICYPSQPKDFDEDSVNYSQEFERTDLINTGGAVFSKEFWTLMILLLILVMVVLIKFTPVFD